MKKSILFAGLLCCMAFLTSIQTKAQTNQEKYEFIDLYTGEIIHIYYDTVNWKTINKNNNSPVDYYVIRYKEMDRNPDTVHGITGIIVNDLIWRDNNLGKWTFNEARVKWDGNEFKMKDKYGRKVKCEKGELKIKDWNNKYKSEAGDDTKYKEEWDKIKWKDDEIKVEKGTQKTKINQ
jgi:hypothetical protein